MDPLQPMDRLQQAYRDLDLSPLVEPEDIERFRIDYGLDVLVRLKREIQASKDDGKFVFTGHRGCGKSTLLKRLAVDLKSQHHVVFFSVADLLELSAITHVNILYAIALQLISSASQIRLNVPEDIVKTILGWNQQLTQTEGQEHKTGVEFQANLLSAVTLKLQQEKVFRDELETTFAKRISELVSKIDRLAATIQSQTTKTVVVIIDDLDKLDVPLAEDIYQKNVKSLFSPGIRIVFTIPVSAIQEPQVMGALNSAGIVRPRTFAVAKFFPWEQRHDPQAEPIAKTLDLFLRILERRIPGDLIDPETAREMVLKSGGVLRELVRLGRECCTEAMVRLEIDPEEATGRIDGEVLALAVRNIRNDFARQMGASLYEILQTVYDEGQPLDSSDLGFVKLLHGLMVLEYENDALWYDVHPIVLDLLKRQQAVS